MTKLRVEAQSSQISVRELAEHEIPDVWRLTRGPHWGIFLKDKLMAVELTEEKANETAWYLAHNSRKAKAVEKVRSVGSRREQSGVDPEYKRELQEECAAVLGVSPYDLDGAPVVRILREVTETLRERYGDPIGT